MKALILSGGKGTRLHPITYTSAKQLVPVANKPVLFYTIEAVVAAGIREIGIVVGDTSEEVKAAVGTGKSFGRDVCIQYIHQERPLGLAHAVKIARSFLGEGRFVMLLGDNFIEESISPFVEQFTAPGNVAHAQVLLAPVPNPCDFGTAFLRDRDGKPVTGPFSPRSDVRITHLSEKPQKPESNLAIVGIYFFDHHIFEAVEAIRPSERGELEITDAIQYLLDHHYRVTPHLLTGYWIDTGKMKNMLDANRVILSRMEGCIAESAWIDESSSLSGEVVVEESAEISGSVVRGPCIIGRHVKISNAYIGPFTAIDHHSVVANCEIEHSIVMEGCDISDIAGRIEDSLIGRHVCIQPSSIKPRAFKLLLGDHSKVELV